MFGPSGRLDRADPAVVAVVDVADVEPGALARQAARAERADRRRFEVSSASGLVWSMNWLSWLPPKNSFIAATTGPDVDERVRGRLVDLLDRHALADDALHAQQADPERVLDQLAVGADAAVAEVVDVVLADAGRGCTR